MADIQTLDLPIKAEELTLIGTGGSARTRAVYVDGQRTGETVKTAGGSDVHRLTGMAVSLSGHGLDGAQVETGTPMDDVPAGAIFRVEGECSVTVRAEGRAGFGGGGPRGVLTVRVFAERLVPVGNVADLARQAPRPAQKGGE